VNGYCIAALFELSLNSAGYSNGNEWSLIRRGKVFWGVGGFLEIEELAFERFGK
jgi:hypothetical protein